ncbi:MAG: DUF4382 domain-containing protein [Gillisia sp.]|nr:DUF4382 domain-containing protein [Gillisia sp.]
MKNFKLFSIAILLIFATSCSKDNSTPDTFGNVTVNLTDAPMHYDQFKKANVTIDKLEIGNSTDPNSFIVMNNTPMKVNLMELVNGVTHEMASLDIPEGNYNMIKLYISSTEMVMKNENSYEYNMELHGYTDNGMMQNGMMLNNDTHSIDIPLDHSLMVTNGSMDEYLLDIDVENSFIPNGVSFTGLGSNRMMSMSGFTFTPMMRFINMKEAGTFQGTVSGPNGNLADATITLMQNDTVYTTTHTDMNGNYALIGIPEGDCTIMVEMDGYIMNTVGNESNMGVLQMMPNSKMIVDFSMILEN